MTSTAETSTTETKPGFVGRLAANYLDERLSVSAVLKGFGRKVFP